MLEVRGLQFAYANASVPVLDQVDLAVADGEFVCLIGPSGCGKSTLLRIVMGLERQRSGTVALGVARGDIGLLFQSDALLPWRSACDNVALGLRAHGMAAAAARREAERWLASVGLEGFGARYPRELSGGQRKRVAIAQVLALRPRLLLMDEPFASLDAILRRYITQDLLGWVEREHTTVLMVTHDLDQAAAIADRVALMSNGPRARVKAVYDVPLARPRDLAQAHEDPGYVALVARLWSALREEIRMPPSPLRAGALA